MELVGQILSGIATIGSLICFILVLIKMFQNGATVLGIVSIFICLVAFIYGWVKSSEWGIRNVMLVWTACIILGFIAGALSPGIGR